MQTTKAVQAINGDRIEIRHPSLDLSNRMTSHCSVQFDGIAHSVVSAPGAGADSHAFTSGHFTVNNHAARIIERVDANTVGEAAVRYEGILESDHGTLTLHSYDSADRCIAAFAALDPQVNPLGVTIGPNARCSYITVPEVTFEISDFALLQVHPLTAEVIEQLPEWEGTSVAGGELFAARMSRSLPYVLMVTPTARVSILVGQRCTMDEAAEYAAGLHVSWMK